MNKKIIIALIVLGLLLGTFVVATLVTAPIVSAVPSSWYGCHLGWTDYWDASNPYPPKELDCNPAW